MCIRDRAKVDSKVNFVYWQVTRGVEPRNHVYEEGVPGKLWVSIRPNTLNAVSYTHLHQFFIK